MIKSKCLTKLLVELCLECFAGRLSVPISKPRLIGAFAFLGRGIVDGTTPSILLPHRFEKVPQPELPVAIYPSHTVPRISTQRSCFAIHGSDRDGLTRLATKEVEPGLLKIPAAAVRQIHAQLVLCGIDEVTIYPDLDGLGRFPTTTLRIEAENKNSP
jgi:hypothetical protein